MRCELQNARGVLSATVVQVPQGWHEEDYVLSLLRCGRLLHQSLVEGEGGVKDLGLEAVKNRLLHDEHFIGKGAALLSVHHGPWLIAAGTVPKPACFVDSLTDSPSGTN